MAVEAENLVQQFVAEAVHHGHHDDQRGDAKHDAQEGETGDDGDKSFLATCPQIASRQQPLEWRERWGSNWLAHGFIHSPIFTRFGLIVAATADIPARAVDNRHEVSRATTSAGLRFSRVPSLRRFISILPSASPFGPTKICQGIPIRSAAANLAPARWSVSSYRTSTPLAVSSRYSCSQAASVSAARCLRVEIAARNGATDSGHLMPASSWQASMIAPTSRDTPTP